jgi:hypothetical protein
MFCPDFGEKSWPKKQNSQYNAIKLETTDSFGRPISDRVDLIALVFKSSNDFSSEIRPEKCGVRRSWMTI